MRVFKETQRFRQWWLCLILTVSTLVVITKPIVVWVQWDFEDTTFYETGFWIGSNTLFTVILLFIFFKLWVTITIFEKT